MKKKIKVISLFDGISCAQVALKQLGYIPEYYASEIDKYAIQVAQKNHPKTMQLGDVKEVTGLCMGKIDLLIGGSPCQDLSISKQNREGLKGKRSGLFYEYLRILKEAKPKYFVLENVASMPKEAKDEITKKMEVEPIMINAALVSAQQRKRLFWTNIPNITIPEDRGIYLKDIVHEMRGEKFDLEKYIVKKEKTLNHPKINIKELDQKARAMGVNCGAVLKGTNTCIRIGKISKGGQGERIYSINGKSIVLSANGGGKGRNTGLYYVNGYVRRLTPIECARLQSLKDDFAEGISNTQQYKCFGNAFNVEVVKHILKNIK